MSASHQPTRRHERIPVEIEVRLSTIDPEPDPRTGRPFFRASRERCANLSPGGAFLRTADPLPLGRRVLVELELPDGGEVEAVGRVAWTKTILGPEGRIEGAAIGVEFLSADGGSPVPLDRFLGRCGAGPDSTD